MNALIIFTRIISAITKINHNNKFLIKCIILKFFDNFLRHLETFVVREKIQMSKRHNIDEFLSNRNQIKIQSEKENSNDHDDVDFKNNEIAKIYE